jgi:cytochrome P450
MLFTGGLPKDVSEQIDFYTRLARQYGDYVRVNIMPGFTFYLVLDPAGIEHILQTHQNRYRKPDRFNNAFGVLAGNGLVTSEGSFWLRQRRLMQPGFHKEAMLRLTEMLAGNIQWLLKEWDELPDGSEIVLSDEMMRLTLKNVGMALFGIDISEQSSKIGPNLIKAFQHARYKLNAPIALPEWLPTKENKDFKVALSALDEVVWEIIAEHKNTSTSSSDLLGMLIAAQDADTGERMTDKQLRDEVITLLIAGHDTVGAALSWAFILLSQNRDKRKMLNDQVRQLRGKYPEWADMTAMPYVKQVFDESMRLYPPAWGQPREALEDDIVEGYLIEKGQMISLCQFMTHRDPRFWSEPEKFFPERFADGSEAHRPKFAYFPFGGGSRMCIGNNFATMEAMLAIAAIVQKYDLDLVPDQKIDMDLTFTLKPKGTVKCILRRAS